MSLLLAQKVEKRNRWSSLELRGAMSVRNRVVVPAMASEKADEFGLATKESLKHYSRLGESGAGLIIAEYSYVHPSGRSEPRQLGAWSDDHTEGLQRIATTLKRSGAMAGLQLVHSGGKSQRDLTGGALHSPSGIIVPVKDRVLETPDIMGNPEIDLWRTSFLEAARRAVEAGFDLVEIHAAHGYGLSQWLSPITNRRDDNLGAGTTGRVRLLVDIVADIRRDFPSLVISTRIPGQDFIAGGLGTQEMTAMAVLLVRAGVDVISVSSGLGGWRRPIERREQGYLVDEARQIQKAVTVPVIGVGGIEDGTFIDRVIGDGDIALAAVGRAILKDPSGWFETHLKQ